MNKKDLRMQYSNIRKNINNKEKRSNKIYNTIINLKEYKDSKTVLTYISINDEIDTFKLIKEILRNRKKLAVPKCEGDIINFYYINSLEELDIGTFGIPEPQSKSIVTDFENSICIVPGICFDREGNRVGYGKGYYDRFLKDYKGTKIGLTYKECICDTIDVDENDIKLDKIIIG